MSFKNANQAIQDTVIRQYRRKPIGMTDAVLQARRENNLIREQVYLIRGKKRELKVNYYPIDCNSVADDCNVNFCDPGDAAEMVQENFNLSRCTASKVAKLYKDDVRLVDNEWNFSEHGRQQIASKFEALRQEMDREITTLILANAGLMLDGNATKRVSFVNTTTGVVEPVGMWEIEQDFLDAAMRSPYIVGGREVFQWGKALGIAADNNTTGQDYRQLSARNMFYDNNLNTIAGDLTNGQHIIAFDPEALKFMSFNENMGIFATDVPVVGDRAWDNMYQSGLTYAHGVIVDPATGLMWDLDVRYDECEKAFTYLLKIYWDIFFPQIQACNPQGVNGIFHYRTCPIVIAPCPTGTSPVSPVAQRAFNWNPGFAYPQLIGKAVIGGVTTYPNVTLTSDGDLVAMMNDSYGKPGLFSLSGSNVTYQGYSAIAGNLNDGEITISFA